jgi:hypothetical protein
MVKQMLSAKGSAALVAVILAISPAWAQSPQGQAQCNDRDRVVKLLADKYEEAPIAVGVTNTGGLVEVLTTGSGATWTIIITSPKGWSCLIAAGEGWREMPKIMLDPEA